MKLFGSRGKKSHQKAAPKKVKKGNTFAGVGNAVGGIGAGIAGAGHATAVLGQGFFGMVQTILINTFKGIAWFATSGYRLVVQFVQWTLYWWAVLIAAGLAYMMFVELNPKMDGTGAVAVPEPVVTPIKPPVVYQEGLAPLSGKDDRVPLSEISATYDLVDPQLPGKLSGLGKLMSSSELSSNFFGVCTASLVGRSNFVITASHCVEHVPASLKDDALGRRLGFYSLVCDEIYTADRLFWKTQYDGDIWPSDKVKRDYAFIRLSKPVCVKADPFQAIVLKDDVVEALRDSKHPLLSLSVFKFSHVIKDGRFANAGVDADSRYRQYTGFGVLCILEPGKPVNPVFGGETDPYTYHTKHCDTYPGNSGGPLLVSLDMGRTYQILGTLYGSRASGQYSSFPRVKGIYAQDLEALYTLWDDGVES